MTPVDERETLRRQRRSFFMFAALFVSSAGVFVGVWLYRSFLAGILAIVCYAVFLMLLGPLVVALGGVLSNRRDRLRRVGEK